MTTDIDERIADLEQALVRARLVRTRYPDARTSILPDGREAWFSRDDMPTCEMDGVELVVEVSVDRVVYAMPYAIVAGPEDDGVAGASALVFAGQCALAPMHAREFLDRVGRAVDGDLYIWTTQNDDRVREAHAAHPSQKQTPRTLAEKAAQSLREHDARRSASAFVAALRSAFEGLS